MIRRPPISTLDPLAQAVAPVHAQHPELLDLEPACGGLEVGGDHVGPVEDGRLAWWEADRPACDLHRSNQLQRLYPADTFQLAEIRLMPGEESRERASFRYEPGRQGEHVLPLGAASDNHRQELGVTQCAGAEPLERSEERRVGKECRSRWSP